jgi:predicted pyridoxine 5'-phosphate oxidase superfamily flavin-nucleotide-binding protein
MMLSYHKGELAVQAQAGVQIEASRISKMLRPTIPPIAQTFLRNQQMVIASTIDAAGNVWASLLTGELGFLAVPDEQTVEINATPAPGDPLAENIHDGASIGLIAVEFATRRRIRINGHIEMGQESIIVHTDQVFSNCHKYIHAEHEPFQQRTAQARRTSQLTEGQQRWIASADTFFIASYHVDGGADASHRGGPSGFVRVEDATRLLFPDYSGNRMFQTLGNLSVNPRAGLLFLDFERGDTLQLTGRAHIHWDEEHRAAFAGAERVIEYSIDEVVEIGE